MCSRRPACCCRSWCSYWYRCALLCRVHPVRPGGVTDWFDGYWARRFNQVTQLGRVFDPFVDKIIVCGMFIFLAAEPISGMPPWMAVVVVGREMLVTALRSAIEQSGGDFSAKMSGKLKMVFQCIAAGGGLLNLMYGSPEQTPTWLIWAMPVAVWVAMFLTIYSGIVYVFAAAKLMRVMKAAFFSLAVSIIVPVGAWGWALAVHRWRRGRSLLAAEPRRPVPWSLLEVLVAVLVLSLLSIGFAAVQQFLDPRSPETPLLKSPQAATWAVLLEALAKLGSVVLVTALLRLGAETSWRDLGWEVRKIGSDLRLGVIAFAMLALPVYGLQMLLITWFPSHHPLIELLHENPDPRVLLAIGISVVLAAPVAEEFFFRVLLQGWLERAVPVWQVGLQGLHAELRETVLGVDRGSRGR